MPVTPSATLVLSMAWGYPLDAYVSFIQSLRDTGYAGDVKLLAAGAMQPGVRDFCASRAAEIVDVKLNSREQKAIMLQRFGLYRKICTSSYKLCLISDFRDVFFQRDPFIELLREPKPPDLILPLEDRRLGPDVFNSYAIKKCYGPTVLHQIYNHTVICSGVIIGTPAGFDHLARLMIQETVRACRTRTPGERRLSRMARPAAWQLLDGETEPPHAMFSLTSAAHMLHTYRLAATWVRNVAFHIVTRHPSAVSVRQDGGPGGAQQARVQQRASKERHAPNGEPGQRPGQHPWRLQRTAKGMSNV